VSSTEYRVVAGVSGLHTDEEAQRIGELLDKRFRDGPIDPEAIVKMAQSSRSPLHRYFDWDDARAAHEHRLAQARGILRSIAVIRFTASGEQRTRAFHNVTLRGQGRAERAYVSERVVWASPELADQIVVRAERELLGWQARYEQYQKLRGAVELVAAAVETLAERST
jgi:hypothetical protein